MAFADKTILIDLYHGNYIPEDLISDFSLNNKAANDQTLQLQREIRKSVDPELWDLINQSYSMLSELEMREKECAFVLGFQTGVKLLLSGLDQDLITP